jgi:hypothetical protein
LPSDIRHSLLGKSLIIPESDIRVRFNPIWLSHELNDPRFAHPSRNLCEGIIISPNTNWRPQQHCGQQDRQRYNDCGNTDSFARHSSSRANYLFIPDNPVPRTSPTGLQMLARTAGMSTNSISMSVKLRWRRIVALVRGGHCPYDRPSNFLGTNICPSIARILRL